jgi:hypothetical protein
MNPFAIIAQVSKVGMRPKVHPQIPAPFQALMQSCWDQTPDLRPSCKEILEQLQLIKQEFQEHREQWEQNYRPLTLVDEWSSSTTDE